MKTSVLTGILIMTLSLSGCLSERSKDTWYRGGDLNLEFCTLGFDDTPIKTVLLGSEHTGHFTIYFSRNGGHGAGSEWDEEYYYVYIKDGVGWRLKQFLASKTVLVEDSSLSPRHRFVVINDTKGPIPDSQMIRVPYGQTLADVKSELSKINCRENGRGGIAENDDPNDPQVEGFERDFWDADTESGSVFGRDDWVQVDYLIVPEGTIIEEYDLDLKNLEVRE